MSFYDSAVPAYLQMLNSLSAILDKAEAHCAAKKIEPEVLLGARLFPDMLPFSKQIQLVGDFAAKGCARMTARGAVDARHRKELCGAESSGWPRPPTMSAASSRRSSRAPTAARSRFRSARARP